MKIRKWKTVGEPERKTKTNHYGRQPRLKAQRNTRAIKWIIRKQEVPENNQYTNQHRNCNQTTRLGHEIVNYETRTTAQKS